MVELVIRRPVSPDAGFTLIEMLAAIGILLVGLTGLLSLMGTGVSTRRTAELRSRATLAVDEVFDELLPASLAERRRAAAGGDETVPLPEEGFELTYDPMPAFPRLRAQLALQPSKAAPSLWEIRVRISWREEGVEVGEDFTRVVDFNQYWDPFPARVARSRRKP